MATETATQPVTEPAYDWSKTHAAIGGALIVSAANPVVDFVSFSASGHVATSRARLLELIREVVTDSSTLVVNADGIVSGLSVATMAAAELSAIPSKPYSVAAGELCVALAKAVTEFPNYRVTGYTEASRQRLLELMQEVVTDSSVLESNIDEIASRISIAVMDAQSL